GDPRCVAVGIPGEALVEPIELAVALGKRAQRLVVGADRGLELADPGRAALLGVEGGSLVGAARELQVDPPGAGDPGKGIGGFAFGVGSRGLRLLGAQSFTSPRLLASARIRSARFLGDSFARASSARKNFRIRSA